MRCRDAGRGIEADLGPEHAATFRRDLHPDLRADYVLANPPFNPAEAGTNFAPPRKLVRASPLRDACFPRVETKVTV